MFYLKFAQRSEIQFVYPNPEGRTMIFFTPFMAGVNNENICGLGIIYDNDNQKK